MYCPKMLDFWECFQTQGITGYCVFIATRVTGNVLKETDHVIKAAATALSDMQEFRNKKEWKLMLDAANGWMKRKMLPDTNMLDIHKHSFHHFSIKYDRKMNKTIILN